MISTFTPSVPRILRTLLAAALLPSVVTSQEASDYTVRVQSDLVLVNVTVRDKTGNIVSNLKPEDFSILEDNKPQKIVSFDLENIDAVAMQSIPVTQALPEKTHAAGPVSATPSSTSAPDRFKDRRLIVLFFDLSAM